MTAARKPDPSHLGERHAAPGTLVSGTWSIGGTPSSCTADGTGSCQITRTRIAKSVGSATWTHAATGSKVTIRKP
jgi:hypothetical protein